jgi:hypothetical protein
VGRLVTGDLERDLEKVRRHKLGVHGADMLELPALRAALDAGKVLKLSSRHSLADMLPRYLDQLIDEVAISPDLRDALRIDLAVAFPADEVPSPQRRGELAAAKADRAFETYRKNRAGRIGPRKLVMQKLASALDPENRFGAVASPPASPDRVDADFIARFHPLQDEDLDSGLWWRPSTDDYIEQLVELPGLTVFAGADGVADVGPPLRADLMLMLLRDCLGVHPILAHLKEPERAATADKLVEAVRASDARAGYVGSIVRGLYQAWDESKPDEVERRLHAVVQAATHGRTDDGYVSTAITRLAFALRRMGKDIRVVSAHYDSDLVRAGEKVASRYRALESCGYEAAINVAPDHPLPPGQVPLVLLNGSEAGAHPGMLMLGEADIVAARIEPTEAGSRARVSVLEEMLNATCSLFVGTSLSDPGLLTAVARTRGAGHARFAILPSPISEESPPGTVIADEHRAAFLAILAARYQYLNVIPIVVDFRYQVPQLLVEIARRAGESEGYRSYSKRIEQWWTRWADDFGFGRAGDSAPERIAAQARWHEELKRLRERLHAELTKQNRTNNEELMIEVWLRDPRPDSRNFFRWANSEGVWERSRTAPVASLREVGELTQQTFREGQTMWSETSHSYLGRWHDCVATNLVLDQGPWADLPVGVVKVFSTRANERLRMITPGDLERVLVHDIRRLFDEPAGDEPAE